MSGSAGSLTNPKVLPVNPENIPALLKAQHQWVVWRAKPKPDGGLGKVPIDPSTGTAADCQDPRNHLSFKQAMAAYSAGTGDGIGIVLTGKPVSYDAEGVGLYVVGIDLDKVAASHERSAQVAELLPLLSGTYLEKSPSGQGLRLFALSREKPRSGQGSGGELYAEKRFLTVTGQDARGKIRELTGGCGLSSGQSFPSRRKHATTLSGSRRNCLNSTGASLATTG
jgi:primase-polymerase (primpol)-like protein